MSLWISDEEGNPSLLKWSMWKRGQEHVCISLRPILLNHTINKTSTKDIVFKTTCTLLFFSSRLRQTCQQEGTWSEQSYVSRPIGAQEKYPHRIFQTLDLNLLGTCKWILSRHFQLRSKRAKNLNQQWACTPLHEAFSSSGRLTGDWLRRVSNFAHLHTMISILSFMIILNRFIRSKIFSPDSG